MFPLLLQASECRRSKGNKGSSSPQQLQDVANWVEGESEKIGHEERRFDENRSSGR